MRKIFDCLSGKISLEIVKYNKFVNIIDKENEPYIHIFFNDNKKETKKYFLNEGDKVTKINIIIDCQIISFRNLFYLYNQIESICFKKILRKILSICLVVLIIVYY